MVIHLKVKAKLHMHRKALRNENSTIKAGKSYARKRSPKIKGINITNSTAHNVKRCIGKNSESFSDETQRPNPAWMQKQKTKNTSSRTNVKNSSIKFPGMHGAKAATEHIEGGEELRESATFAYMGAKPVVSAVSRGATLSRKKVIEEQRKQRIKKVDSVRNQAIRGAKETIKNFSRNTVKKSSKEISKKVIKVSSKQATKLAVKIGSQTVGTAAGTAATGPGGIFIGMAASKAAGIAMEKKDIHNSSRNRMVAFFLNKLGQDNDNSDSVGKLLKDLVMMRVSMAMKYIATYVGGFLLLLVLLIAIVCIPVMMIIALMYNSPFAIFLPPLEEGDTVRSVTSSYVQEFNQEMSTLASNHIGYDSGRIIYVDFEGDPSSSSNYYDIMAVYIVKHGVGETATIMNDTSKEWLKEVFRDMCSYTTSSESETFENEDGTTSIVTTLVVNVTLKSYSDMISIYSFDADEVDLLEEIMSPENLGMLSSGNGG